MGLLHNLPSSLTTVKTQSKMGHFKLQPCPDKLCLSHPRSLFNCNLVQTSVFCHTPKPFQLQPCPCKLVLPHPRSFSITYFYNNMLLPHPRAPPTTNLSRQHGPGTCSGHTPVSSLLISKCCYQRVLRPLPLPLVATVWITPASIVATLATAPPPC
jgi:hypothetical protein